MAIETDTYVTRIPLDSATNLEEAIRDTCELHAGRIQHRRLAAAFAAEGQVILIFQRTQD